MDSLSLIEDCQTWIERNNKSWNSYFSKWETYAKYEETLGEEELFCEQNEGCKSKGQIKKKKKPSLSQKRLRTLPCKKQLQQHHDLIKKKNKCKRKATHAKDTKLSLSSNGGNLSTVIENNQLEITLKTAFSNFLKANRNNFQIFSVLFRTYSQGKVTVQSLDNLTVKQKVRFPCNHFYMNVANYSFESKQTLSLPSPQSNLAVQPISPYRNASVESIRKKFRGNPLTAKREYWTPRKHKVFSNESKEGSFNSNLSNHHSLLQNQGAQTPPMVPRQNLEVKSCPPLYRPKFNFEKAVFKSFRLDFTDKFPSSSSQKTNKEHFKNSTISKMSSTQETKRFGDSCLLRRTNSVNLRMGNSNFITPEGESLEQKHFSRIVPQRKHLPKKLFFENEKDIPENVGQNEYPSPVIPHQNKRFKSSELKVVDSDSDDCESIFDRVKS